MKMKTGRTSRGARVTPVHALLAAAILGLLVMPVAFAGAEGPRATATAVTNAKFKKLKQRVGALESRGTAPSGPAGGDLAGTFPNPQIGPNAVGSNEVAADSLAAGDLAPDSVGLSEIAPLSVAEAEIIGDSVGSSELRVINAVVSAGTAVGAGAFGDATASCPAGHVLLGGGYAWANDEAGSSIIGSTPNPLNQPTQWLVRGRSTAGNTLFAWATCLTI
jgi:hypothetical protein